MITVTVKQQYEDLIILILARHRLSSKGRSCDCGAKRDDHRVPLNVWHRHHLAALLATNVIIYNEKILSRGGASA